MRLVVGVDIGDEGCIFFGQGDGFGAGIDGIDV
jgi:hypothetical protein